MNEEWKTIPGFEGYLISSKGQVKSFKRGYEILLKTNFDLQGYMRFRLNGRTYHVHQIVAMAFLNHKPCGFKLVVDHIDENILNNDVSNLRIVTNRFNTMRNQKKYISKYKGVTFIKKTNKWNSAIKINGIRKHIGNFNCEICAHLAYLKAVKTLEK
jgi:hypothetical protein